MTERRRRLLLVLASGAAYAAVASAALALNPALTRPGPLSCLASGLRDSAGQARERLLALTRLDPLAPWTLGALDLSVIYVSLQLLLTLTSNALTSKEDRGRAAEPEGRGAGILLAALLGHALGSAAAFRGGGAIAFYALGWAVPAALWALAPFSGKLAGAAGPEAGPAVGSPRRRRSLRGVLRILFAALTGLCLVLAASPLDSVSAALSGSPLFPEAWHPLSVLTRSGGWGLGPCLLFLLLALAVLALERGESPGGGPPPGGLLRSLAVAPAYVLLLGPSSPWKGLATAFVCERFRRVGTGAGERALFVLSTVGAHMLLVAAAPA